MELTAVLAGFAGGLLGAMGFGGGGALILWFTLGCAMPQVQAQGLNLLLFLPGAALALFLHRKHGCIDRASVLQAVPAGLCGAVLGFWLSGFLPAVWLRRMFGILLAGAGVREILRRPPPDSSEKF